VLAEERWYDIALPAGRAVVPVAEWRPPAGLAGMLAVEYELRPPQAVEASANDRRGDQR
jgi:hypothetical protein